MSKAYCRQIINALKVANRIDAARPIAPPVTPRAIARIALALTSPSVRHAVDVEQALGALTLASGGGQPTLEDELTDLVETAVGWRYGDVNFRDGTILIGHDTGSVIIGQSRYAAKSSVPGGLQRITLVTNRAIAQIARELLPSERGIV
ncbi:hypothetical protein [Mesorhizobium muleiense]|uniref:hypothetical protein n=1 Tax=Mesorhizobium muleiense TaxID=1004279 RepID=UPI001F4165CD|nr:hypothetical protein [Mesorhizobium muleiense]MCF6113873.1 hypothetical protein [Mesorhizobium muleiense]